MCFAIYIRNILEEVSEDHNLHVGGGLGEWGSRWHLAWLELMLALANVKITGSVLTLKVSPLTAAQGISATMLLMDSRARLVLESEKQENPTCTPHSLISHWAMVLHYMTCIAFQMKCFIYAKVLSYVEPAPGQPNRCAQDRIHVLGPLLQAPHLLSWSKYTQLQGGMGRCTFSGGPCEVSVKRKTRKKEFWSLGA